MEELYALYKKSNGVVTDTRTIQKNQIFFAIKGDKFDANEFAYKALELGAMKAVVDNPKFAENPDCILVDNVLETIQKLANYHRNAFNIPVIGLTGSNGKTTNKELLTRVLGVKYKVHSTKGNLNNHLGVPLTLLEMPVDTEMAVIEMGANHQKEIEQLCNICEPTHGFITNLGKAHLEGFGGEEGVKKGKGELFDFLKMYNGTAFVNETEQPILDLAKEKKMILVVYFGHQLSMLQESPVVVFENNNLKYTSHIGGKYNFDNLQTAIAIGSFFNVPIELACQAAANYIPDNNRSQVIEKGSNSFLMDAYNANPSSMAAAVANFANLKTTKSKVVILGDMFELGDFAKAEHENLGKQVAAANFDTVVLYGENMKNSLPFLPNAYYFTDKFSLHNWLIDKHFENAYFLVKGSRGVGLESILTVL